MTTLWAIVDKDGSVVAVGDSHLNTWASFQERCNWRNQQLFIEDFVSKMREGGHESVQLHTYDPATQAVYDKTTQVVIDREVYEVLADDIEVGKAVGRYEGETEDYINAMEAFLSAGERK